MPKIIGVGFDFATGMFVVPENPNGASVASGAGANVFGVWVQLLANVGVDDIYLEYITHQIGVAQNRRWQIGVGAGGSEVTVCDVCMDEDGTVSANLPLGLGKVKVAAGSRLAIRMADLGGVVSVPDTWVQYTKR